MSQPFEPFGLYCPDGREAQLLSVQVQGEILGLMLRLTVRQTWRNASGAPMATRLNFPMDWDQTLLGLQIERPQGTQSLTHVSRESRQRCSATPGVLATGEQITLQWRIGQLLKLQGGSLRLQLPAGLVPRANRPAQIGIEVHEPLAQGTVGCASHELLRVRHSHGVSLSLRAPAGLDKDLVLTVHGLREVGFALAGPDLSRPGTCTVLMSTSPRLPPSATPTPLRMKLLMDTSSAMPVERLSLIRAALDKQLAQLRPEDQLSYSRFGERTVHDLPRLQICTEAYLKRVRTLTRHTDSELGTPDPLAALQATLAIPDEDEQRIDQADLLLITASPIWAIETAVRALRAAGHRLHVMAVGHAGDSLWRELAEASGGAFERLDPGQHSQQTLARLIERMRQIQPVHTRLTVKGEQPLCVTERLTAMADGDTLHMWVQAPADAAPKDLAGHPELQACLQWQPLATAGREHALSSSAVLWDEQGDLSRVCAARQALLLADDTERQQHLAQHGLVLPDTARLAAGPAQSKTFTQAPATPAAADPVAFSTPTPQRPKVLPATTTPPPTPIRSARQAAQRHADLAGWLSEPQAHGNPLTVLVEGFNAHAGSYAQFRAALSGTLHQVPTRFLDGLVLQLTRQAGNPGRVWALLLHWLHSEHDLGLNAAALQLVAQELSSMPLTLRTQVNAALAAAALPTTARQAA